MKDKWSYLAGIFDGEGNVTINSYPRSKEGYTYFQHELTITIKNTSLALMRWLVANFGGVYYTTEFPDTYLKTIYAWRPKGAANKKAFLLGVMPYLVIKQEVAKLGLRYCELGTENAVEERKALSAACKALNHRGKPVTTNTLDTDSVKIESDLQGDLESAPAVTQVA